MVKSHNILFLDQFGTLGGGQQVLWDILSATESTEFRPAVALNGEGAFRQKLLHSRITTLNLPLGNYHSAEKTFFDKIRFFFRTILCSLLLLRFIISRRLEVLYANGPRTFACATVVGYMTRRPVIWHLHNVHDSKAVVKMLAFLSRWVKQIVVCSSATAKPLLRYRPELESKIKLIRNPIPRWSQTIPTPEVQTLREFFQLKDGFTCFGILGRITPFKGQSQFIEAARLVLQEFEDARFFVIGSPEQENIKDQAYYLSLKALVKTWSLDSRIFFIDYQAEIEKYYSLLDVVVIASQGTEASPRVITESMFLGKAIIAPNQPSLSEMIEDGKTGFLVDKAEPHLLASRMLELIHRPEKRVSAGREARNQATTYFGRDTFEREIRLVFESCLKKRVLDAEHQARSAMAVKSKA
jgi:glycosyltransferase involved in cell wall biosynthesis